MAPLDRLPKRSMTGQQITRYARLLRLPNFRGVYMLNGLPSSGARRREQGIVNLDGSRAARGTHWIAYSKQGDTVHYFDSFGNLRPPPQLVKYWRARDIRYNYKRLQGFKSEHCGALCLRFLRRHVHSKG